MSEKSKVIRLDHGPVFDLVLEMKQRQQTTQTQLDLLSQQYGQHQAELQSFMTEKGAEVAKALGVAEGTMVEIDTRYLADHGLAFVHIGGVQNGGLVRH